ncbi:phage portal protein [Mycobacteroides abscessus]|uniref:phage portal protein n=1 Tax=Mycobacteroides abscessus TaxID=36809 RepID=UPI0021036231|nr:phage portal protein [Mycobacteroides abscessus]
MTAYEDHVDHLQNVLSGQMGELQQSESYLDSSYRLETIGLGVPPEMRKLRVNVGWPALYLRAIEERLDVEGFRVNGQSEGVEELWQWWQDNDLDEESGLGHMDAMTFRRSYITVAAPGPNDDADYPLIRLESPLSMYAELDPRTHNVTRACRFYHLDSTDPNALIEGRAVADAATLLLPDRTIYLRRDQGPASKWIQDGKPVVHNLGVVPVVPLVNRAKLSDRQGQSEISPEIRSLTDAAARTLMNLQAASELIAVPLRGFFGVDRGQLTNVDGNVASTAELYYGRMLTLSNKDAKSFEFSAADLRNFAEELNELAKQFAAYTGLPPQYLSFSSDNPASAEAIQASESRLVKTCERKARMFGGSWERAMRLATKVMGKEVPEEYHRLETVWRDPSTPTISAKADAATKLYANGQGPVPKEQTRIDLGYTSEQRDQMREWDAEDRQSILTDLYAQTKAVADATPKPDPATKKPASTGSTK